MNKQHTQDENVSQTVETPLVQNKGSSVDEIDANIKVNDVDENNSDENNSDENNSDENNSDENNSDEIDPNLRMTVSVSRLTKAFEVLKKAFTDNLDEMYNQAVGSSQNNEPMDPKIKQSFKKFLERQLKRLWKNFVASLKEDQDKLSDKNDPNYEELSDPNNFRLTTKPINPRFKVFWDLYHKQLNCMWKASEIDYSDDKKHFNNILNADERIFVEKILSFFAASDGIVNVNLRERILCEIQVTEAQYAYGFQLAMENIHAEVYSDMLNEIISDEKKRDELFNGFKKVKSIKGMTDWAQKWIDSSDASLGKRVIAFAIVEGVFFSGAFASIYWLKKHRSKGQHFMNGLVSSNTFIARDEGLHTNFACELYKFINNRVPVEEVAEMFNEALKLTKMFSKDAIQCELIGMSTVLMNEYNEYVCDRLLVSLGYEKMYHVTNPFEFMETIGFLNKDNFFEKRPTDYQTATNNDNKGDWKPKILDEFAIDEKDNRDILKNDLDQ